MEADGSEPVPMLDDQIIFKILLVIVMVAPGSNVALVTHHGVTMGTVGGRGVVF